MKTLVVLAVLAIAPAAHAQHVVAVNATKADSARAIELGLGSRFAAQWNVAYDSIGPYRHRTYTIADTLTGGATKYRVISRQNLNGDWVKNDTLKILN